MHMLDHCTFDGCYLCLLPSQPAAAICELVKPDDGAGGMARRDDMVSFCTTHRIPSISIRQMQVRCAVVAHGRPAAWKTGITTSTQRV